MSLKQEEEAEVFIVQNETSRLKSVLKNIASLVTNKEQKEKSDHNIDKKLLRPPPIFMTLITSFQISIFIFYLIRYEYKLTEDKDELKTFTGGCVTSFLTYHPKFRFQLWRHITASFLHSGNYHLFKNMMAQVLIGIPQEIAYRIHKIAPLYFGGVGFSIIMMNAIQPNSLFGCGASGGDYALIFAQISNLMLNWREIPRRKTQAALIFLHIFSDFGEDIYLFLKYGKTKYAHGVHFNSAIFGLIYGFFILHYKETTRLKRYVRTIILASYFLFVIIAIVKYFTPKEYFHL
ncbi:unnamed protein product [Caenorhabditis angaria]|uniref:Peptidase S54 rhomboid domain-containing protein n=1 Tax=Caenorhabditis angaria TaxID=860376 RepID=A0A9P1IYY2_9PELO|nr:unnamed protein product [Caenorhabditis angaria]